MAEQRARQPYNPPKRYRDVRSTQEYFEDTERVVREMKVLCAEDNRGESKVKMRKRSGFGTWTVVLNEKRK